MRPGLTSGRQSARAAGAFTLIEMMTVLVLIGIVTAMIIPEMKGTFEDALLRSTSRDLVNVIELASSRAVSLNQTVRIKLDTTTGRYEVERQTRQGALEEFAPLKDVVGSVGKLDSRITVQVHATARQNADANADSAPAIENPEDLLTFRPDGTASSTIISLKDRSGFELGLRVSAVTSRVTILEPKHE